MNYHTVGRTCRPIMEAVGGVYFST